jgi:hypothetical protein
VGWGREWRIMKWVLIGQRGGEDWGKEEMENGI